MTLTNRLYFRDRYIGRTWTSLQCDVRKIAAHCETREGRRYVTRDQPDALAGCNRCSNGGYERRAHLGVVDRVHNIVLMRARVAWHHAHVRARRASRQDYWLAYHVAQAHAHLHARARWVKGKRGTARSGLCAHCTRRAAPKQTAHRWPLPPPTNIVLELSHPYMTLRWIIPGNDMTNFLTPFLFPKFYKMNANTAS